MSKLERKNHKVFGINATETKVGQFGSANATTKITTKDVEKIQALDAWEQGWEAGAVGNNHYPTQQERTGVDYEHSYQIGYMLQEGVPEWNKDTTYNKGSIVKAYNGTTLQNYVSLVDENLNNPVTDITKWKSGLANSDLSNLTTAGEKHFLNKSQITNCLIEVPQRIKYTLENGTLTIKAGSVVIVPYGTKDKTADLPKGATFINENFKVYDTQYTEDSEGKGKFFVWAELQVDNVMADWGTVTENNVLCLLATNSNVSNMWKYSYSGDTAPTLASETNGFALWYDTKNNLVKATVNNGSTWTVGNSCFPHTLASFNNGKVSGVNQVFDRMGYIGSTIWVDKGVKGLVSIDRNEADGTLINKEVVIDKLNIITLGNYTASAATLAYLSEKLWDNQLDYVPNDIIYEQNAKPSIASNYRWYDTINGKWYINDTGATVSKYSPWLKLAEMSYVNGKITSFTPKLPFRAADENDIDGRWVSKSLTIIRDKTYNIGVYDTLKSLDILPNDGCLYKCLFRSYWRVGSSNSANGTCPVIKTSFGDFLFGKISNNAFGDSIIEVLLRSGEIYKFGNLSGSANQTIDTALVLFGYRRVH